MHRTLAVLSFLLIAAAPAAAKTVKVMPGDSLGKIAQRELGDGLRWQEICDLNKDTLGENCDRLLVGATIIVPDEPGGSAGGNIRLSGDLVVLVPEEAELKTDKPDDYAIAANPAGGLSLKGHLAEASSGGRTGGVYFDLPAGYEQKFSGRTVRIDVLASAEAGSGDFQMAYSTNDVGNSRWQPLKAPKGAFDIASFTYEVPALKNGNGDFIGILPDPDGTGNVLAIRAISLKIVN